MIHFVQGDLFCDPTLDAFAHGCNCAGAMGAGIALEFKRRYPEMFRRYHQRCEDGRFRVGDVWAYQGDGVTVFNLGTQAHWNTPATSPALNKTLCMMISMAEALGVTRVGMPRIGAGLGGLDWNVAKAKLMILGRYTPVELRVFEDYVPGKDPNR